VTTDVPQIVARDLVKTYTLGGSIIGALQGVSVEVPRGEYLAVTGPSGSGKSTFMHLIGALDSRTTEEIIELFEQLNDTGITVIIVTHEPDIARRARRRLTFRDGKIVEDAS